MDQNKPKCTVTLDDLLADLKPDDAPGGLTVREICDMAGLFATGSNMARVRGKLRDLMALGEWEFAGKPLRQTMTGISWPTPAYRPRGGNDL